MEIPEKAFYKKMLPRVGGKFRSPPPPLSKVLKSLKKITFVPN